MAESHDGKTGTREIVSGDHDEREVQILERLRANDPEAIRDLADLYARELSIIAVGITGSRDLAQDIFQDVLLHVWTQRATLTTVYDLGGFMRRLMRHRAIDVLRHERAQLRLADRVSLVHEFDQIATNPAEARLVAAELRSAVLSVLDTVPPRCREIFLMRWEGGMSYAEISETLGITRGTVHTQMYRAMKALSAHFERHPLR
jgi:RNA polymerase sigma-70 factor (ECF subfamily)